MILVLASASPRRAKLLRQINVPFRQMPVDVDETVLPAEAPRDYVTRVALAKAREGYCRLRAEGYNLPVLGCDTAVVIDNAIFGKPKDIPQARQMLHALSGRGHEVMSGLALCCTVGEFTHLNVNKVYFRPLNEMEISAYIESGEPFDKAGGYAIQGRAALFIQRLEGSYSGVMGLPLFELGELLTDAGLRHSVLQRIPPGFPQPPDTLHLNWSSLLPKEIPLASS